MTRSHETDGMAASNANKNKMRFFVFLQKIILFLVRHENTEFFCFVASPPKITTKTENRIVFLFCFTNDLTGDSLSSIFKQFFFFG